MLFVFMSQPDFACNPHALWKYIVENTDFDTGWILKRNNHYEELKRRGLQCAIYDTIEGNALIEKADYVITNSYTFLEIPKRENQIFVNLWHGSGIKAHDFYEHNLDPRHVKKLTNFFDKIDLMCVHSLDDRFKLSAMLRYDLRKCYVTGQARLDCVKTSNGKEKLVQLFGDQMQRFEHFIFFAPSFRANMSTHSGKFCSDNIFRLDDYDDEAFKSFLAKHKTALIYKLHPIEQTAFQGRDFKLNDYCYELTDNMLFDADIRYDEILNAFDLMVSDYSSIAYDFLVLDRPLIYLIPDYEEYKQSKGFVFQNIDFFMPGPKVYCFADMLKALDEGINHPDMYSRERFNVIQQRFDFTDARSAERCLSTILNYHPVCDDYTPYISNPKLKMPSSAEFLKKYIHNTDVLIIDSTKEIPDREEVAEKCRNANKVLYISGELPAVYRKLSGKSSYKIWDYEFYSIIKDYPNVRTVFVNGGVEYSKFDVPRCPKTNERIKIGFAGTIDNRIYFAMVQYLCEALSDCDLIFAGDIFGDFPIWLKGYDNLHYVEATYDELPDIIQTFDVAILPFFGGHKKTVPTELFQYLACGKSVVTSDMPNLPECPAIYKSTSVSDSVEQVKEALKHRNDEQIVSAAKKLAKDNDWECIAGQIMKDCL